MARSSRFQIAAGAAFLLAVFLVTVFFAARATFREQLDRVQARARVIAAAALSGAGDPPQMDIVDRVSAALPVPPDGAIFVLNVPAARIVGARGPNALLAGLSFDRVPGDGRADDPDGIARAYGTATDPLGRWRVVIGLPQRLVWDATMPIFTRNAINAGWWYLLSVGALYWFIARQLTSVANLEKVAARVAAGDLNTPRLVPMATSELESMQRSMVEMVTRVRELQRQVVRQERLAAIGVLVSGVAHEINNPLQAILGYSQVIASRADMPADARADLAVIQRESERASTIIRNLSRFTRQQPSGPTPMRLNDIVIWLGEMWQRRFDENGIEFELSDRSTKTINAVATEIQQVALNFLTNAEYAVLHNPLPNAPRRILLRTCDTANGNVRLEIEDSGAGVSSDHDGNLFQPFFTTKPVGEGTGLGLSVSYGIVHSHGGTIGHERSPLGGARFYLELPAQ